MSGEQDQRTTGGGISRRRFVRDAGLTLAGASLYGSRAFARRARAAGAGRRVAILGGGMAGLAAAHELIERGFDVTVYERNALGGKARSIAVPKTAGAGRRGLPGEHGFRFFPGFYHHVPDTMRRIPFPGNAQGVWDNLTAATGGKFLRAGDRADAGPFGIGPDAGALLTVDGLRRQLIDGLKGQGVPPQELEFFVDRLLVFLTSSDVRRFGQWEHTSWWDFVRAQGKSQEYRTVIAAGLTRNVVAAKETVASARTIGHIGEAFVWNVLGFGNDGYVDRVLNLPTNEAWIDPWVAYLTSRGVKFEVGAEVESLDVAHGRISGARIRDARPLDAAATTPSRGQRRHDRRHAQHRGHGQQRRHGTQHGLPRTPQPAPSGYRTIDADWYIVAMPVERARRLWSAEVLGIDPSLQTMDDLFTDWMVGIQFYLRRRVDITYGHITFIDSPWALTALTQAQFWKDRDFQRDYGDGAVADCLSVDISNWDAPGILYGKPAKECTAEQVAAEVWAQIKQHHTAAAALSDDLVHSWYLDPGIQWDPARAGNTNETPLLVNTIGSWEKRPQARTKVPNMFLAGDYVQTDVDLATMEGANESGRGAVNALLDASASNAERVRMFELYRPPEFEGLKVVDAQRYASGQANVLDQSP